MKTPLDFNHQSPRISEEDYRFICNAVYLRSRINLGADKKDLVTSRLAKRLRQLHLASFSDYCQLLRSPAGTEEWPFLIDRMSTNHTYFFREEKHFDFLTNTVLPQWRARCPRESLRVWSAASSSGEEAFSIAVHLAENLGLDVPDWEIEASDISTRVLEVARQGVYESAKLERLSPEQLRRHFQKGVREWEGQFRVKSELRQRVRFHHLNLLAGNYPFTRLFNVIFCRNVMIYFDRPTQTDLIARLSDMLIPGGHLLVGHSESLSGIKHNLKAVQPAVYTKALR